MPTALSHDYESFGAVELVGAKSVGVWNYTGDWMSETLMAAWRFDGGPVQHADLTCEGFPRELKEALEDPHVEKWAFNAAFERLVAKRTLRIKTPYAGWRCTMALANLQSFSGDLFKIGEQMGVAQNKLKGTEGKRLIKKFCMPQKITRKNPHARRNRQTDPDDWLTFCDYNVQDVVAEDEIKTKLLRFPIPADEWELYELDQKINDRGLPVNVTFVKHAHEMSERRKAELTEIMRSLTHLANPNSTAQLLPWLVERGYPFRDLKKNTVLKVLSERPDMDPQAFMALKLRQQASRTSVKKYPAIMRRVAADNTLRHCFQFAGAARTGRWAGRGPQPHNLTKTPKELEAEDGDASRLEAVADVIESGDYGSLKLLMEEPMSALAGSVRSSFQAPDGFRFTIADLSAIESAVAGWLTGCVRLLNVFQNGLDPYKDFGVELFHVLYEAITKAQRTICKPAVLGCTYQLGGGDLREGKRTGLWGYAEARGVDLTREEAHTHVKVYREVYHEIVTAWRLLEDAVKAVTSRRVPEVTLFGGKLTFKMIGPYLTIILPSGRPMYYYKPRIVEREFVGRNDEKYKRMVFSYMGLNQVTRIWGRVYSSGGKILENVVQAIARDVLKYGMLRADREGFRIVGSVHDEIMALTRFGDNRPLSVLVECMKAPLMWAPGLPLGAAGYEAKIYRKD